jgi:hypothetical protein
MARHSGLDLVLTERDFERSIADFVLQRRPRNIVELRKLVDKTLKQS